MLAQNRIVFWKIIQYTFPILISLLAPTTEDCNSEDLLGRLREGDSTALSALYDRYCRLVYTIAYHVLRDSGEAEDMVQEVFLAVFRHAHTKTPGKGSVRGWIISIAHNSSLDRWRLLSSRRFYKTGNIEAKRAWEPSVKWDYSEILNRQQRLEPAMESLTPRQRKTLELYFYEGLTPHEIAEEIQESHRNVRNHLYRGIEKLRTMIRDDGGNQPERRRSASVGRRSPI